MNKYPPRWPTIFKYHFHEIFWIRILLFTLLPNLSEILIKYFSNPPIHKRFIITIRLHSSEENEGIEKTRVWREGKGKQAGREGEREVSIFMERKASGGDEARRCALDWPPLSQIWNYCPGQQPLSKDRLTSDLERGTTAWLMRLHRGLPLPLRRLTKWNTPTWNTPSREQADVTKSMFPSSFSFLPSFLPFPTKKSSFPSARILLPFPLDVCKNRGGDIDLFESRLWLEQIREDYIYIGWIEFI